MNRFVQTIIKTATIGTLALGLVLASSLIAAQATIITTPNVYLYGLPKQNSKITSTINEGTNVKVIICNSAWCFIKNTKQASWKEGWVETNKLSNKLAQATNKTNPNHAHLTMGSKRSKNTVKKAYGPTSATLNISITIVAEDTQIKIAPKTKTKIAMRE